MCLSVCLYVCLSVCLSVCVCVSLAIDSSESTEVIIIRLGTVTASDVLMHHVLIILTLTFIQDHTYLNHENNNCLIIKKPNNIQAMTIKLIRLKVYNYDHCQSDDLDLHSRTQVRLIPCYFLTCNISNNVFRLLHSNLT